MLDKALNSSDKKDIDDRVRRILRSMCNPAPRGKRVVYDGFYLGKAYLRWYWAHTMSEKINLKPREILQVLNAKSYGKFAGKMHSGKSYISSP